MTNSIAQSMSHRNRLTWLFWPCLVLLAAGCGSDSDPAVPAFDEPLTFLGYPDDDEFGPGSDFWSSVGAGPTSNGLFDFEPGELGALTGVHAIARLPDTTMESNEVEVRLVGTQRIEEAPTVAGIQAIRASMDSPTSIGLEPSVVLEIDGHDQHLPTELGEVLTKEERVLATAGQIQHRFEEQQAAFSQLQPLLPGIRTNMRHNADQCEEEMNSLHTSIPTINGWTCWMGFGAGTTVGYLAHSFHWVIHMTPRGFFLSLQAARAFELELAGINYGYYYGCSLHTEDTGERKTHVSAGDLEQGTSLTVSLSSVVVSYDFTIFFDHITRTFSRAFQLGMTYGFGLWSLFSISPASFSIGFDTKIPLGGFVPVRGWTGPCLEEVPLSEQFDNSNLLGSRRQPLENSGNPFDLIAYGFDVMATADAANGNHLSTIADLLGPGIADASARTGQGPATHIAAATNADFLHDFLRRQGDTLCDGGCVDTSLDYATANYFLDMRERGSSYGAIQAAGHKMLHQIGRSAPNGVGLTRSWEGVIGATDLMFDHTLTRLGQANRPDEYFISEDVVEVHVQFGDPGRLEVALVEVAELMGVEPAELEGARLCAESVPRIDKTCLQFVDGRARGWVPIKSLTPLYLNLSVDLSEAVGTFPPEAANWTIKPAARIFRPSAGAPTSLNLVTATTVAAGGTVSLMATLTDQHGAIFREPTEIEFFDASGERIGSSTTHNGTATLQFIGEATYPKVEGLRATSIAGGSGTQPGYILSGQGFSRSAVVLIDGQTLEERGYNFSVNSSREIAIAQGNGAGLTGNSVEIIVVNPFETASEPVMVPVQ